MKIKTPGISAEEMALRSPLRNVLEGQDAGSETRLDAVVPDSFPRNQNTKLVSLDQMRMQLFPSMNAAR
jgi:hypothetical protein